MKNFSYRLLLVITLVIGMLFICSVPEASDPLLWWSVAIAFFALVGLDWLVFKDLTEEEKNEILMVKWFKKIGIDINEED